MQVKFRPQRLGHANLFVGDLERSIEFYGKIAGIELVRREPGINAGFHSNGNTHHDLGLIQCFGGVRHGIGGFVQPSSFRGHDPGLNHFGWEVNSEADLVQAVKRAEAAGVRIVNYANHQVSHSVYIVDPDGNYHEFYADVVENWRAIFNLEREDLVTERWEWQKSVPGRGPMHPDPKDRQRVEGALFHPRRITHATLVAKNYEETLRFLCEVGGLDVAMQSDGMAGLRGAESELDLVLLSARFGLKPGLHGVSLEVESEKDLIESAQRAKAAGVSVIGSSDRPAKRSVLVSDPDGLAVEFYVRRTARAALPDPDKASADTLWAFAA